MQETHSPIELFILGDRARSSSPSSSSKLSVIIMMLILFRRCPVASSIWTIVLGLYCSSLCFFLQRTHFL